MPGSLSDIRILRRLVLPVRRDLEERSFAKESFEDIKNHYIFIRNERKLNLNKKVCEDLKCDESGFRI